MAATTRRGMTLVEMLVAVLIVGVLAGLAIRTIDSARREARRAQCTNNLKQLTVAMHNYQSTNGVLPIGAMGRHGKGYPNAGDPAGANNRRSWSFAILPYYDSSSLYNSVNFNFSFDAPANISAVRVPLYTFLCPEDPGASARIDAGRPTERVRASYAVNWGNTHFLQAAGPDPYAGPLGTAYFGGAPFGYDAAFPISSLTDGLADTLLMSELLNPGPWDDPTDRRGDIHSDDPGAAMFLGYSPPNATTPDQVPPVLGSPGCLASGADAPCNRAAPAFNAARSRHRGGVHAAMADGSVRFVRDSIGVDVWRALSTSQGEQKHGPDSY